MPAREPHLPDSSSDYYELLGLAPFETDLVQIDARCRELMREARRYQVGRYAGQAEKYLNLLASARDCLHHPERKREYDEQLRIRYDLPPLVVMAQDRAPPVPAGSPAAQTPFTLASAAGDTARSSQGELAGTADDPAEQAGLFREAPGRALIGGLAVAVALLVGGGGWLFARLARESTPAEVEPIASLNPAAESLISSPAPTIAPTEAPLPEQQPAAPQRPPVPTTSPPTSSPAQTPVAVPATTQPPRPIGAKIAGALARGLSSPGQPGGEAATRKPDNSVTRRANPPQSSHWTVARGARERVGKLIRQFERDWLATEQSPLEQLYQVDGFSRAGSLRILGEYSEDFTTDAVSLTPEPRPSAAPDVQLQLSQDAVLKELSGMRLRRNRSSGGTPSARALLLVRYARQQFADDVSFQKKLDREITALGKVFPSLRARLRKS